jgi:hypothetical protein
MRLDTGIFDSEWVYLLDPLAQLAWVRLLIHVKTEGVKGTAKALSIPVACKKWGIPESDIQAMLAAAREDGALAEGAEWSVTNWLKYQESPSTERVRKHRALQIDDVTPENVTERYSCHVTETETETGNTFTNVNGADEPRPSEPFATVERVLTAVNEGIGKPPPDRSMVGRYLGKNSSVISLVKSYGEADATRLFVWGTVRKRLGMATIRDNAASLWAEAEACNWGAPPERGKKSGWGDPAEDIRKMTEDLLRG